MDGFDFIKSDVNWGLNWIFSVDNCDVKETLLCKASFDDGFSVRGITLEVKNAGSDNSLCFFFWDFEESDAEFFSGIFESCITVKGALLEAPWLSNSSFRKALEPCKVFLTLVKRLAFCERSESELCGETVSL